MPVTLRAAFGEPGVYLGDFIPTTEGDYIFKFTGSIAGVNVDQTFESGPNRFSPVQGLTALEFPQKQPAATALQSSVNEAQQQAEQARMFGIAGIVVGALGLLAAGVALATRRHATERTQAVGSESV